MSAKELMDVIVESYVHDVTNFYERERGRFVYRELAKKVFDSIQPEKVRDLYVALLDVAAGDGPNFRYGIQEFPATLITKSELLLNMIVSYQLAESKPIEDKSDKERQDKSSSNDPKRKRPNKKPPSPRVVLWIPDSCELFERFLRISLIPEHRIWKQIKFILNPTSDRKIFERMAVIFENAVESGTICFTPLVFLMNDSIFSKHIKSPSILRQALYLGKLKATTVESFVIHRPQEFRAECREILRQAELASQDLVKFESDYPKNIPLDHVERRQMTLRVFRENVNELMKNLRGELTSDQLINVSWAAAAIKKYSAKTYNEKTWKEEQLYDLIWTVLSQRGKLKKFICEHLEKVCHDYGAAHYWSRIASVSKVDPLTNIPDSLNFPKEVESINFVTLEQQLHGVSEVLQESIRSNGNVIVGIDAEWSAYLAYSRASILQLAVRNAVFIIDIESKDFEGQNQATGNKLEWFVQWFFSHEKIIKIGFQFNEDLSQLRAVMRKCSALYEPKSLYCIGKVVVDLLEKTEMRSDGGKIKEELFPNLDNGTFPEISSEFVPPEYLDDDEEFLAYGAAAEPSEFGNHTGADESVESKDGESTDGKEREKKKEREISKSDDTNKPRRPMESPAQRTIQKGLSSLCFQILGHALDKTEQCSVWNRRPLRPLQIRYAAMDAYCILMLYDKCAEWASRLNVGMEHVLDAQTPIKAHLPLLQEFP
ncbi:hypothetical protein WR25_24856 [Diploscapter pachys]|uniref:3'-5' exonuclease domain-containing protein n=1 Tax=Diploscapter pachys TaxID=2018661 RepID=A0A2A2L4K7_9BILA|nr:hypothetical protein WR25_24856 [Diploscapter pachys]